MYPVICKPQQRETEIKSMMEIPTNKYVETFLLIDDSVLVIIFLQNVDFVQTLKFNALGLGYHPRSEALDSCHCHLQDSPRTVTQQPIIKHGFNEISIK